MLNCLLEVSMGQEPFVGKACYYKNKTTECCDLYDLSSIGEERRSSNSG